MCESYSPAEQLVDRHLRETQVFTLWANPPRLRALCEQRHRIAIMHWHIDASHTHSARSDSSAEARHRSPRPHRRLITVGHAEPAKYDTHANEPGNSIPMGDPTEPPSTNGLPRSRHVGSGPLPGRPQPVVRSARHELCLVSTASRARAVRRAAGRGGRPCPRIPPPSQ
jgi:hypothetical protein